MEITIRETAKPLTLFKWWFGAKTPAAPQPRRRTVLDHETEKLLREIVSNKYHQIGFSEPEFDEIEGRPFFARAVEDKLISVNTSAQTVFVVVGIRRNGYIAIGETPRFTFSDFVDDLKAKIFG
jgi:hypothetical protein